MRHDLWQRKRAVVRMLHDLAAIIADHQTPAWLVGNAENHTRDMYRLATQVRFETTRKKLHVDWSKEVQS